MPAKFQCELPDKMSELLTLALDDLDKVEQKEGYWIDMGVWHSPRPYGVCRVCMAGAVLVEKGFPKGKEYNDIAIDDDTVRKLDVINTLRLGMVGPAARQLGIETPISAPIPVPWRHITHYSEDPVKSKADLRKLAADLKEAGL